MAGTDETGAHDWAALRAVFKDDEIAYKPQPVRKNDQDKGRCERGTNYTSDGIVCGGWHSRSLHLTYVGHAALTERLDMVCGPESWSWEPFALDAHGLPAITPDGSLWIRLTIWGVTKAGVGDDEGTMGPRAYKVMIGDALRNAGMRFGIARYLWDKSEKARDLAKQERGGDEDEDRQALPASRPAQRSRGRQQPAEDPFAVVPLTEPAAQELAKALQYTDPEAVRAAYRVVTKSGWGNQTITADRLEEAAPGVAGVIGMASPGGSLPLWDVLSRIGFAVAEHKRSVTALGAASAPHAAIGSRDPEGIATDQDGAPQA